MMKILLNLLLLLNTINSTYSLKKLTNKQIIDFKTYDNMSNCESDIYNNDTTYTFNYDCNCFSFYDDDDCLKKINMSNIFNKNNLSNCLYDNMTYQTCYTCNNKVFSVYYDLENNLCYSYVLTVLVFTITISIFLLILLIRYTNNYRKRSVIFIKKQNYNSIE